MTAGERAPIDWAASWELIAAYRSMAAERRSGLGALGRSRELVRGNGWHAFGVILVLVVVVEVVVVLIEAIGDSAGTSVGIVVRVIVQVLAAPLAASRRQSSTSNCVARRRPRGGAGRSQPDGQSRASPSAASAAGAQPVIPPKIPPVMWRV